MILVKMIASFLLVTGMALLGALASADPPTIPTEKDAPKAVVRYGASHHISGFQVQNLSPSGDYFVAIPETSIRSGFKATSIVAVCETATKKTILSVGIDAGPHGLPSCFAFDSNKRLAIGLNNGIIEVWDIPNQKKVAQMRHEKTSGVGYLTFGNEGRTLVSVDESSLMVWEIPSGKEVHRVAGAARYFSPTCLSGGTAFCCGDNSGNLIHLDSKTGSIEKRAALFTPRAGDTQPRYPLHSLIRTRCSSDGKNVACLSSDGEFALYSLEREQVIFRTKPLRGGLIVCCFSPDNQTLYTTSENDDIHRWDVRSGKELEVIPANLKGVLYFLDMAASPDGKTVSTLATSVRTWDVKTGREITPGDDHKERLTAIVHSARAGLLATASIDQTVCLWDATTGERKTTLTEKGGSVSSLAFLGEGQRLAVGSDDTIRIWEDGKVVTRLSGHGQPVLALAATPDGNTLVSGGHDASLRTWNTQTGAALKTQATAAAVRKIAVSTDGRLVASLDENREVLLWNVAAGTTTRVRAPGDNKVWNMTLSPSGHLLVVAAGPNLYVWETTNHHLLAAFKPDESVGLGALRFLTDRLLVTASGEFAAVIDWPTGRSKRFHRFESDVSGVDVGPDLRLYTAHMDTLAFAWDLSATAKDLNRPSPPKLGLLLAGTWDRLGGADPIQAHTAIRYLLDDASGVTFLKERLTPLQAVDEKDINATLARLEDDDFATREKAMARLLEIGEVALPALRKRLAAAPEADLKAKLDDLISKAEEMTPERLRGIRAVLALEMLGTPAARDLLGDLAKGAASARLTRDAVAALQRLDARPKP